MVKKPELVKVIKDLATEEVEHKPETSKNNK
jgi:hypothetical protein